MKLLLGVLLLNGYLVLVHGHGMVLEPPGRSSRWRFDKTAPENFEDNQLFCGGFQTQYNKNGGKCGMCGDNYADASPRENELGGKYGQGVIVGTYKQGGILQLAALITANHMGYFYFQLCDYSRNGETEECFDQYKLNVANGGDKYYLNSGEVGWYNVTLQLPKELVCEHCILQWTYRTGNSWGDCGNGTGNLGCGPQEHFRSCSDVKILPSSNN